MAQPTNTFASNNAVGNREDLSDIIYDVSPTDTPVLSMIGKNKATGVKHEWQRVSLAAASNSNFVIEGDDATTDAGTVTTRVFNYCGISDKVAQVSGTQEATSSAGRKSEMAFQMSAKMKELKRDVESIILANTAYVAGSSTVARKVAGLQTYVLVNSDKAADATASAGDGSSAHTSGTARALTESLVEGVLATAWSNGAMPSIGVLNAFQKRRFANFSGNSTRNTNATEKKIVNSVDIYIDPLGNEVRLVPDRYVPTNVIYFIDPEYLKFSTLRDFHTVDLAKTGDSERKQILVEYTMEVCTGLAHAAIYDLSAS